jgi:hypothetical protein
VVNASGAMHQVNANPAKVPAKPKVQAAMTATARVYAIHVRVKRSVNTAMEPASSLRFNQIFFKGCAALINFNIPGYTIIFHRN